MVEHGVHGLVGSIRSLVERYGGYGDLAMQIIEDSQPHIHDLTIGIEGELKSEAFHLDLHIKMTGGVPPAT